MHGPLLQAGSQAWSSDESQNSNTKCLVQVKCNTSRHQAIIMANSSVKDKQKSVNNVFKVLEMVITLFSQLLTLLFNLVVVSK